MISKERKFIFIHNFKTGGTSIEKKLGHFNSLERDVQDHRTIKDFELLTNRSRYFKLALYSIKIGKPAAVFRNFSSTIFPPLTRAEYESYYKFTFVRNTWAQVYSWYANVMKDEILRASYGIHDTNIDFEEFLLKKMNHEAFCQWNFITDKKGIIPLDFIGRFENLQNDFNIVCERLEIENTTLPKLLVRKYSIYQDVYTQKCIDLVYDLYRKEIDHFNFQYGE